LNVMDGLLSPYGAIFILTTNHKESLDTALIRPGRVDLQLCITYANDKQKQTLYNRFFEGACLAKYLDKRMTIADLQQALMIEKREKN
jgi:mitochondrial chaperone BCS1